MNASKITRLGSLLLLLLTTIPVSTANEIARKKFLQHSKVLGAESCIECHESEVQSWKQSHHYGNKDLHKNEKAAEIARKMGISSPTKIRQSALCTQCHFTVQKLGSAPAKVIDGVSCESCHGGAKDWLDVHNTGDRRESDDTPEAQAKRSAESRAKGMISPDHLGEVAANCYSCHIITDENLVNKGGHPAGTSSFELASWIMGETRHNFFHSKGKTNAETSPERRRVLYVVGQMLEMEYSMRGLARAKEKADYGKAMGQRCVSTRKDLDALVQTLGANCPPEILQAKELVNAPGLLKFFNAEPLTQAADSLEKQIELFVENHDGSELSAIDGLIPTEAKGQVYQP